MPDLSEQQFSASLESVVERPQFVVSSSATPAEDNTSMERPASRLSALDGRDARRSTGESDTVTPGELDTPTPASDWRHQVSAKVSSYKSRRPRKERYPSLQLPFEAGGYRLPKPAENTADSFSQPARTDIAEQQSRRREPETPVVWEATARVLEFPRPVAAVSRDELAEPVIDRPRILEAPELLPPPPALGGILIEPPREPEPERRPGFDVPLQSAPLSRRLWAATIDAMLVVSAQMAFVYVLFRIAGVMPPLRPAAEASGVLLVLLWFAYQYAFLVYSGTTPGLRLARLEVSRFEGVPAARNLRRWRVLASLLSCASLGIGYAWCFLDEDQLCWHDRITKTHLAEKDVLENCSK
jgi:uncharacterized RDD family membrane protein YckC